MLLRPLGQRRVSVHISRDAKTPGKNLCLIDVFIPEVASNRFSVMHFCLNIITTIYLHVSIRTPSLKSAASPSVVLLPTTHHISYLAGPLSLKSRPGLPLCTAFWDFVWELFYRRSFDTSNSSIISYGMILDCNKKVYKYFVRCSM